jgi:ribosomal protein S26
VSLRINLTDLRIKLTNLPVKIFLVATVPAVLATFMFNYSASSDGSVAIAWYRFGVTYLITAVNFCAITWIHHRVIEVRERWISERAQRKKHEKDAREEKRKIADLIERVTALEEDKRCLQRLHKEWTPADDARLMNMFQDEN